MIKMIVMTVREGGVKNTISFETFEEIKEAVQKISAYDLRHKKYEFVASKEALMFFEENFNKEFYTIDKEIIYLKNLSNGIRRTKNFKRIQNNTKTLRKLLERITKDLKVELYAIDVAFHLDAGRFNVFERFHYIHIKLDDLAISERTSPKSCEVKFDKVLWKFEIISIESSKLKSVYDIIRKVFEKRTSSTRNYRRRGRK
jgi:hypothetical protein